MQTVVHHGRETAYTTTTGDENRGTICFVHGSGGSSDVWQFQRRLGEEYRVVTLDLSGHGESADIDASPGYTTLSAYADDVLAVAAETDAEFLVGNSLGGAVVLHVLLERDFDPDAVVLTGTGARLGVLEDLLEWLESDFERAVEFLHAPDRLFHDPDERVLEISRERMYDCGRAVTARDFRTCHRFDVRSKLSRIDTPTLVLYGEHDRLTPPRYHEALADGVRDATLEEIEDTAHLAMLERPRAFNEKTAAFLDSLE